MPPRPLVSVVMPSFQQAAFLEEAVGSVLDDPGVPVELLVYDPGSTDGSREILERLRDRHGDALRLHFEPDDGQSDAINKGMAAARGEILCWLNSDDRLRPGALRTVAERLGGRVGPAWLYGRARMVDGDGRPTTSWITRYKNWRGRRFTRFKLLTENFISQMATFWNAAMWREAGGLDPDKHLDMDYDLWLRFAAVADPVVVRDELADFRVHADAKGSTRTAEQLADAYRTCRQHAGAGLRGGLARVVHRCLSLRTRLVYGLIKPRT